MKALEEGVVQLPGDSHPLAKPRFESQVERVPYLAHAELVRPRQEE